MNGDSVFRYLFIITTLAMMAIRIYYQRKVRAERRGLQSEENRWGLLAGALAALTAIIFGLEYIFAPGTFSFAYAVSYPDWLRWLGALMLAAGISLLWLAHHHLGRSFDSMVTIKEAQTLVDTGPYRTVRHPIYTAYFLNYIGGGLLAANLILTFVPVLFFGIMIALRIRVEEAMMLDAFGQKYEEYMTRTGRFLPFF